MWIMWSYNCRRFIIKFNAHQLHDLKKSTCKIGQMNKDIQNTGPYCKEDGIHSPYFHG